MSLASQISALATRIGAELKTKVAGDDARLSNERVPTDLSVTNAKVATNAAIALSKLATGRVVGQNNGTNANTTIWYGTQAQYDAIGTKNSSVLYFAT